MARRVGWRRAVLLVNASLLASLLLPAGVSATHRGDVVDEVTLQISYQSSSLAGARGQLVARLQMDDGTPIADLGVEFWREVEFLGPRRVVLGGAKTGADGTAIVSISPSESTQRVGARFAGNASYLAAEGSTDIPASGVVPPASPTPAEDGGASLALVSSVMPPLLALTAFVIWLLLIGVAVVTVLAIRRERPSLAATRKGRS